MSPEAAHLYSALRCALYDLPNVRLRTVERDYHVLVDASADDAPYTVAVQVPRKPLLSPSVEAVEWEAARRLRRQCLDNPFFDRRPSTRLSTLGRAL